jgi:hypothetical protein
VRYTYDRSRTRVTDYPASFFAEPKPSSNVSEDNFLDYNTLGSIAGPPPTAPQTDAEALADATLFRSSMGFNADPTYVTSTLHDPALAASAGEWGVPLTEDELNEMQIRQALATSMQPLRQYGLDHGSEFAGDWIDEAHGGLVYTAWTANAAAHLEDLKAIFPYADRLRVTTVPATLTDLDTLRDKLDADWDSGALEAAGFDPTMLAEDETTDTVKLGVPTPTADLATKLTTTYGSRAQLVQQDVRTPARHYPPLVAGLLIEDREPGGWGQCTDAYSLRYLKGGERSYARLTAGHCGDRGSLWKWRPGNPDATGTGTRLGRMKFDTLPNHPEKKTYDDAAAISESGSDKSPVVRRSAHTFMTITGVQKRVVGHQGEEQPNGAPVCQDGVFTFVKKNEESCGSLDTVNGTNSYKDERDGHTYRYKVRHVDTAIMGSRSGDSGAAVYTKHGVAVGVLEGGSDGFTDFEEIGWVTSALRDPKASQDPDVVTGTPRTAPPSAATYGATNVGANQATLHGVVNPHGLPTKYYFKLGMSTNYDETSNMFSVGTDRTAHKVSYTAAGLGSGTWHYRVFAVNDAGTTSGADKTFRMP